MKRMFPKVLIGLLMSWTLSQDLWACSVCFGDPNSPIVHGAKAGVAVLLGIVITVIGAIVGVAFYWIRRARLLEVQAAIRGENVQL